MKVTGFKAVDAAGKQIPIETYGNNVSVVCKCGHPVLMIMRKGQRGSRQDRPALCRRCGTGHWATPVEGFTVLMMGSDS